MCVKLGAHFVSSFWYCLRPGLLINVFFLRLRRPLRSTLFPYTTLFRSDVVVRGGKIADMCAPGSQSDDTIDLGAHMSDRKSTRLNSSHLGISYAVFCLKKKNTKQTNADERRLKSTTYSVFPRKGTDHPV